MHYPLIFISHLINENQRIVICKYKDGLDRRANINLKMVQRASFSIVE